MVRFVPTDCLGVRGLELHEVDMNQNLKFQFAESKMKQKNKIVKKIFRKINLKLTFPVTHV